MSIRFVIGLLIGLTIGASVALALAPKGGAETRQELWQKARDRVGSAG